MSVPIINLMQRDENLNNFCPFCGIINADNNGNVSECPHLLFIYVNIAEEMIYVKKNLFPSLSNEEIFDNMFELIEKLDIKNAFILEESSHVAGALSLIGYQLMDDE